MQDACEKIYKFTISRKNEWYEAYHKTQRSLLIELGGLDIHPTTDNIAELECKKEITIDNCRIDVVSLSNFCDNKRDVAFLEQINKRGTLKTKKAKAMASLIGFLIKQEDLDKISKKEFHSLQECVGVLYQKID